MLSILFKHDYFFYRKFRFNLVLNYNKFYKYKYLQSTLNDLKILEKPVRCPNHFEVLSTKSTVMMWIFMTYNSSSFNIANSQLWMRNFIVISKNNIFLSFKRKMWVSLFLYCYII